MEYLIVLLPLLGAIISGFFSKLMGLQLAVNISEFVCRLTKEVVIKYFDVL